MPTTDYPFTEPPRAVETQWQERAVATTRTKRMTEEEYRQFALGDTSGQWELVRGQLREKPGMSVTHGAIMDRLLSFLYGQLERDAYRLRASDARLRRSADTYYVPDIVVIPATSEQSLLERPNSLDALFAP